MAVELILSTDKLQSGFRAKYNASANEIIVSVADGGSGIATLTKKSGGTFSLNLTTSFFTKAEVVALIGSIVTGILITDVSDASGEYDASADGLPEFPLVTIYDANGVTMPASFDNANKTIFGLNSSEAFTAKFSAI